METLMGMPVIINPLCDNVQRVSVSAEFARIQSPELVASTNAWMLKFFGAHDVAYIITDPCTSAKHFVIGPRKAAMLPRAEPQPVYPWGNL